MPVLGRMVKPGLVSIERGNSGLYITSFMGPAKISSTFVSCFLSMWASLVAQMVKNLPAAQETSDLIPGLGRSSGEGNGYPLQYSCL